jgi:hypothetical protein
MNLHIRKDSSRTPGGETPVFTELKPVQIHGARRRAAAGMKLFEPQISLSVGFSSYPARHRITSFRWFVSLPVLQLSPAILLLSTFPMRTHKAAKGHA